MKNKESAILTFTNCVDLLNSNNKKETSEKKKYNLANLNVQVILILQAYTHVEWQQSTITHTQQATLRLTKYICILLLMYFNTTAVYYCLDNMIM